MVNMVGMVGMMDMVDIYLYFTCISISIYINIERAFCSISKGCDNENKTKHTKNTELNKDQFWRNIEWEPHFIPDWKQTVLAHIQVQVSCQDEHTRSHGHVSRMVKQSTVMPPSTQSTHSTTPPPQRTETSPIICFTCPHPNLWVRGQHTGGPGARSNALPGSFSRPFSDF